jgi:hypothetical protein
VRAFAAVGINNDLATRQTRIAVWPANDKLARRIDVIRDVVGKQSLQFRLQFGHHAWNDDVDDILTNPLEHHRIRIEIIVLRRNHDRVDPNGLVIIAVFNRHLRLGIRAEVRSEYPLSWLRMYDISCKILWARSSGNGM